VGRVIKSGETMFIPDIGEEPMFMNKTGSRPGKKGISFISMPIKFKGKVMGALSVDRIYTEEHGGLDDDLRVLRIASSLIAQFVKLWESFRKAEDESETLRSKLKDRYSLHNIVGESKQFQSVLKAVKKVADTDATVLLLGESGTGKELIASTLHFQSRRAKGPYVAVNCAALPENLLEAELFGAEKGAFTGATTKRVGRFETAEGGTIFLDEIGEMPLSLQSKLLRVIQEKTFERVGSSTPQKADVRVIAATNRNLLDEVRAGRFREDLYWRLNVVPVVLPPLREREGDIRPLVNFYVGKFNALYGKNVTVDGGAMDALEEYGWPGNVRELANTIERLVIMTDRNVIEADDIPCTLMASAPACSPEVSDAGGTLTSEVLTLEKARIKRALEENNFVQYRAAKTLGITPRQLGYRIKKYGITIDR
jgi:Nif-specific regulatory protein